MPHWVIVVASACTVVVMWLPIGYILYKVGRFIIASHSENANITYTHSVPHHVLGIEAVLFCYRRQRQGHFVIVGPRMS